MPKAAPLAFLALLIGMVPTCATSQEGAPAPNAATHEQATVTVGRHSSFVSQSLAARQNEPNDSFSVTQEAQRELQRLGCYEGEITGFWSHATRAAAQRFLDRVNAKLATDRAEEALVPLLKGQRTAVCSQCPRGQAVDSLGRCMPIALLKRSASPIVTGSLSDGPLAPVRSKDERTPAAQQVEQDRSTASGQRTQPNSKPSKWQKFIRGVDKLLGLN